MVRENKELKCWIKINIYVDRKPSFTHMWPLQQDKKICSIGIENCAKYYSSRNMYLSTVRCVSTVFNVFFKLAHLVSHDTSTVRYIKYKWQPTKYYFINIVRCYSYDEYIVCSVLPMPPINRFRKVVNLNNSQFFHFIIFPCINLSPEEKRTYTVVYIYWK